MRVRVFTILLVLISSSFVPNMVVLTDENPPSSLFSNDGTADSDGDGLSDSIEQTIALNPQYSSLSLNNWDSDGDKLPDGWEWMHGLDPTSAFEDDGKIGDSDGDGLINYLEYTYKIPQNWDSELTPNILDNGVWWNGTVPTSSWNEEGALYNVIPILCGDSGSDGTNLGSILCDEDPVGNICTDGFDNDYDGFVDTDDPDSDGDADCGSDDDDGDGMIDEDVSGWDTDGDGMDDGWEVAYGLDATNPTGGNGTYGDPDGDGSINIYEYVNAPWDSQCMLWLDCFRPGNSVSQTETISPCNPILGIGPNGCSNMVAETDGISSTHPLLSDTDGDGLGDGDEMLIYLTDPTNQDTDDDGISDGIETMGSYGSPGQSSNPRDNNTDGDMWDDGEEDLNGDGRIGAMETDPTRINSDTSEALSNSGTGDNDNDSIMNSHDSCVNGTSSGNDTDGDGCFNGEDLDDDNDGYMDAYDSCPQGTTFSGSSTQDYDLDGCEDSEDLDDDNDGIPDTSDPYQFGDSSCISSRVGHVISFNLFGGASNYEAIYASNNIAVFVESGSTFSEKSILLQSIYTEQVASPYLDEIYGTSIPDLDNNCQLDVMYYPIDGPYSTAGFFAPSLSNMGEYIFVDTADAGHSWSYTIIAHELSHLYQNYLNPYENLWIDEGAADYNAFLINGPDLMINGHINAWAEESDLSMRWWNQRIADYGAGTLMLAYLHGHLGNQAYTDLLNSQTEGAHAINSVLTQYANNNTIGANFSELYSNFVVAAGMDIEGTIWDIPNIDLEEQCSSNAVPCLIQAKNTTEYYDSGPAFPLFSPSSQNFNLYNNDSELESWGVDKYVFDNVTNNSGTWSAQIISDSININGVVAILESDGDVRTQQLTKNSSLSPYIISHGPMVTNDIARIEIYIWDETGLDCDYTSCGSPYPTVNYEIFVDHDYLVDSDWDGIIDIIDNCPFGNDDWNSSVITDFDGDGCQDSTEDLDDDNDGVADDLDMFDNDPNEWADADGDGTGDNSDELPLDPNETNDTDGDGVGDNSDAFPDDANETNDTDGDGTGDNSDAFPQDPNEWADTDGDGTGDNSDAFPDDANETNDTDGDGTGDNSDAFPNDANETNDTDGDGVGDNLDTLPNDSNNGTTNNETDNEINTNTTDSVTKEPSSLLSDIIGIEISAGDMFGILLAIIGTIISIIIALKRMAIKKVELSRVKKCLHMIEVSQSTIELSSVNQEIDIMFSNDLLSSDDLALLSTKIRNRRDELDRQY